MNLYELLNMLEAMEVASDCEDLQLRPPDFYDHKPGVPVGMINGAPMVATGGNTPEMLKIMEQLGVKGDMMEKARGL